MNEQENTPKFRAWFLHENGQGYSMLVREADTLEDAAEACAVEEEAGGVKCMSIERVPNGRLENLERMLSEVKQAMLIGADPDYFTDHGQMEGAVIAIRKILSEEVTWRPVHQG